MKRKIGVRDPSKTTGRDNPNGGPSIAMLRSGNLIRTQEYKADRLAGDDPARREKNIAEGMKIAEQRKAEERDAWGL